MTMQTIKTDQERDRERSSRAQSPGGRRSGSFAGLLAEEALQDALKGLHPDEITGPGGLLTQLAGRVIETALKAELTEHLGRPPGGRPGSANIRNGAGSKTVQTDLGAVKVKTPRDRDGSFDPKLVGKRQTRLAGLDDKIIALLEDVAAWRSRPLERVYPIVYFDATFVKVREDRSVRNRACYLALGVTCEGEREVLGL